MAYAAFMVCAEPGPEADARLALAADLAERFGAVLIGFAAEEIRPLLPRPIVGVMGGAADIPDLLRAEQERVEAALRVAEDRFRARLGGKELRTGWRAFAEAPTEALVNAGRAADLLILGRLPPVTVGRPACRPDPGRTLLAAGRPVLLVPDSVSALDAQRVLVAWRDTREARRAVADALPFLAAAKEVTVLEICENNNEKHATAQRRVADVAAHLALHGVKATPKVRSLRARSVAEELQREAERLDADLIVAGGYAHARLWEIVWGGVTRDLLQTCPTCCLLSH